VLYFTLLFWQGLTFDSTSTVDHDGRRHTKSTAACSAEKNAATISGITACKDPQRGDRPCQCLFLSCGQKFAQKVTLTRYELVHKQVGSFICRYPGCSKSFAHSDSLTTHRLVHTSERPFSCAYGYCKDRFTQRVSLQRHMRTHTRERPFACPHDGCEKRFTQESCLIADKRVHNKESPYRYSHPRYDKSCRGLSSLHWRKMKHAKDRLFTCLYPGCSMMFDLKGSLKIHEHIHGGYKLYVCDECALRFFSKIHLRSRKRLHEPQEYAQRCRVSLTCKEPIMRSSLMFLRDKC
jgi:KRAB domain-containing zinc finger protein